MSQSDLIEAYRGGEIDSWTCVRRLLKKGVPLAAALSLLLGAPGVALADDGSGDDCQVPAVECLDDDGGDDDDGDDGDDDDDDDDGGGGGIPPIPPNINVP